MVKPQLPSLVPGAPRGDAHTGSREVYFNGAFQPAGIYRRDRLMLDQSVSGPAVIEESGSLVLVPPGWTVTVLRHGELMLARGKT